MLKKATQAAVLFWSGLVGLVFYVVGPILLPDIPKQPELLPLYLTMMGIGQAAKSGDKNE